MTENAEKPQKINFHDTEILRIAGGLPAPITALLRKHNLQVPTDWAVYQWCSRKRIPDKWRASLIYALMVERRLTVEQLFCKAR